MDKLFLRYIPDENIVNTIVNNISDPSRARMLYFNIKKYPYLIERLLSKQMDPIYFAKDLKHSEIDPSNNTIDIAIINSIRSADTTIPDSLTSCEMCSSFKTEHRYVDIDRTQVYCYSCKHTWLI